MDAATGRTQTANPPWTVLLLLLAFVHAARAVAAHPNGYRRSGSCQSWCNVHTCDRPGCAGCEVCTARESGRVCLDHCNAYTCEQEVCAGCDACRATPGEQCAPICNLYTCSLSLCSGCAQCADLAYGEACAAWCIPQITCSVGAFCAGCPGCEAQRQAQILKHVNADQERWRQTATGLADAIKELVFVHDAATGKRKLKIVDPNQAAMYNRCLYQENYVLAERERKWQCSENNKSPNWHHPHSSALGLGNYPYSPTPAVRQMLADFAGLERTLIDDLLIQSNLSVIDGSATPAQMRASKGQWCGMPIPENAMADDARDVNQYWKQCVSPNAGFFNVLQCEDDTPGTYAVLGYAALNQGVCYPAHHHWASEIYWQVDGTMTWTTWEGCVNGTYPDVELASDADLSQTANPDCVRSTNTLTPDALGAPRRQKPMVPHEIDTTVATNGPNTGGLTVYFWGLMNETSLDNAYQSTLSREDGFDPLMPDSCAYGLGSHMASESKLPRVEAVQTMNREGVKWCPASSYAEMLG